MLVTAGSEQSMTLTNICLRRWQPSMFHDMEEYFLKAKSVPTSIKMYLYTDTFISNARTHARAVRAHTHTNRNYKVVGYWYQGWQKPLFHHFGEVVFVFMSFWWKTTRFWGFCCSCCTNKACRRRIIWCTLEGVWGSFGKSSILQFHLFFISIFFILS